jgi:hypothetical protein
VRLLILAIAALAGAVGRADAQACFPTCRTGYACQAGACVPVAAPPPRRDVVVVVPPDPPPTRPRYEVEVVADLSSLFVGERVDTEATQSDGTTLYGRRVAAFGGRVMIREGGNAWLGLRAGYAMVNRAVFGAGGGSYSGDDGGVLFAIEQVFRIPITEPGWDLLVDRKVGLDLSVGGFYGTSGDDLGGCAAVRVSFFWLAAGPVVYVGSQTGVSVGLAAGARVSF